MCFRYEKAINLFLKVLDLCGYTPNSSNSSGGGTSKSNNNNNNSNSKGSHEIDELSEYWEPTVFNLAHSYRKIR